MSDPDPNDTALFDHQSLSVHGRQAIERLSVDAERCERKRLDSQLERLYFYMLLRISLVSGEEQQTVLAQTFYDVESKQNITRKTEPYEDFVSTDVPSIITETEQKKRALEIASMNRLEVVQYGWKQSMPSDTIANRHIHFRKRINDANKTRVKFLKHRGSI